MSELLVERLIYCPYCGEGFTTLLDLSVAEQDYIEDCQVCCRPIQFHLHTDLDNDVAIELRRDDE